MALEYVQEKIRLKVEKATAECHEEILSICDRNGFRDPWKIKQVLRKLLKIETLREKDWNS